MHTHTLSIIFTMLYIRSSRPYSSYNWKFVPFHQPLSVSFIPHSLAIAFLVKSQSHVWLFRDLSARLLCPWDFPSKNTGMSCHFLFQGVFQTQGLNPCLLQWLAVSLLLKHPACVCVCLCVCVCVVFLKYSMCNWYCDIFVFLCMAFSHTVMPSSFIHVPAIYRIPFVLELSVFNCVCLCGSDTVFL